MVIFRATIGKLIIFEKVVIILWKKTSILLILSVIIRTNRENRCYTSIPTGYL
jgi:hypothetical protein